MILISFLFYIFIFDSIISSANSNLILIQNDFITCYKDHLVIHWYYFPFGSKTIQYHNIKSCELFPFNDMSFFERKFWGIPFLFVWWPLDIRRYWRKYYILIDANQWPSIGITMDDHDIIKVYQLISRKMPLISSENEI